MKSFPKWQERGLQVLIYIFALFLLLEWMYPVSQLTDTGKISVFIVFIIFSLLLHYLMLHWLWRFLLLGGYIFIALPMIHGESFWSFSWVGTYIIEFSESTLSLLGLEWQGFSHSFESFLFFLLLWLVTYLAHYWIQVRSSLFFFFILTIIFIAILDTFTPYDGDFAIIRLVVIGLCMISLMTLINIIKKEQSLKIPFLLGNWVLCLAVFLSISVYIGISAPKFAPQWPDPVPFIMSLSEDTEDEAKQSVAGYDEDDTKLGGSILPDPSVVFYHDAKVPHYWKVESKDVYTGKGWTLSPALYQSFSFRNDDLRPDFWVPEQVATQSQIANVSVIETHRHLLYPADSFVKRLNAVGVEVFLFDYSLEKYSVHDGENHLVKQYSIEYEQPSFDIVLLREITGPDETMDALMTKNTQLPNDLPQRVIDLADELTRDETNWYDKVKKVETYFQTGDFVYSKENIPFPAENQDYVDQFLFETQIGYCDNFSTAMVVLLRAAGIPARWAKGYTEGERAIHNGENVYKVTNNNAHSWVEVYFSGLGWVSFEPTKGFTGETDFYNSEQEDVVEREIPTEIEEEVTEPLEEEKTSSSQTNNRSIKFHFSKWFKSVMIALAVMFVIGIVLYFTRRKWKPLFFIYRYKKKNDCFEEAYEVLLKELQLAGFKREEGQTLREYAKQVDTVFGTDHLMKMTEHYEWIMYRNDREGDVWAELYPRWKQYMRRLSSK